MTAGRQNGESQTDRTLTVLSIGGHPKDVVLYAGGTMALHVELGDVVVALTPTYGVSHHEKAVAASKRGTEEANWQITEGQDERCRNNSNQDKYHADDGRQVQAEKAYERQVMIA